MSRYDPGHLIESCRVTRGKGFRLAEHSTRMENPGIDKPGAEAALADAVRRLDGLQQRLYAEDRQSVLAIFQAMDGGGKDSTIRAVFSGINPQGCQVMSFKAPGPEEMAHDFLWRHMPALPARGRIAVHNRSWYEEVLVARIHPEVLARRKLPERCVTHDLWRERLEDIAGFERYLARQGVILLKFFLHLGRDEQRQRFLERIDKPEKNWKFDAGDVAERMHWDAYQEAYEEAIIGTATPQAPWLVVPADRKWLARLIVAETLTAALARADPRYPEPDPRARAELMEKRAALEAEG
jgi:PPK2 family polyphosphate:nucleotide phosphotransferase